MHEIRALCERQGCPVELRARAINSMIDRDKAERGFEFQAVMEFGETCAVCKRTRLWRRCADGDIKALDTQP